MKERILTAVVALALFTPFVIIGGWPFILMIYAIATIGLFEILRMRAIALLSVPGILTWFALAVVLLPKDLGNWMNDLLGYSKAEFVFIIVLLLLIYTVLVKNRYTFDHAAFSLFSALYIGIGFYYFIETLLFGLEFVIYALIVIWMTDTGAYFIGRKIGKHKLWPDISPNKTIEGFVGGICSAILFACIFHYFIPITHSYLILIVVTAVASVAGQLGDLVESAIKRHYDVKDSGNLLPGHGGILDRFDSLLFVFPLLHLLYFVA